MDESDVQVSNEMANRMSLFYAYPTPMLKTLSDATSKFVSEVSLSIVLCILLYCVSVIHSRSRKYSSSWLQNPKIKIFFASQI
jgi:F0F1-type ATP synthase membrane subunit a